MLLRKDDLFDKDYEWTATKVIKVDKRSVHPTNNQLTKGDSHDVTRAGQLILNGIQDENVKLCLQKVLCDAASDEENDDSPVLNAVIKILLRKM